MITWKPGPRRRVAGHHWHPNWLGTSRSVCLTCGLLWLRNPASDRAARQPCPGWEDVE